MCRTERRFIEYMTDLGILFKISNFFGENALIIWLILTAYQPVLLIYVL